MIVEAAITLNTFILNLFDELNIYYKCDTAVYTADAQMAINF